MSATKLFTIEDLLKMPKDSWHELIEGELIRVSPSAGSSSAYAALITHYLLSFIRDRGLGYVTGESGGYVLRTGPDTVVAPDVGFIKRARYPDGLPESGFLHVRPDLAVEVVSPSDELGDMRRKQALYDQAGVPCVWWVDPAKRTVSIRVPGREAVTLDENDVLNGGDILPGFQVRVSELFEL